MGLLTCMKVSWNQLLGAGAGFPLDCSGVSPATGGGSAMGAARYACRTVVQRDLFGYCRPGGI